MSCVLNYTTAAAVGYRVINNTGCYCCVSFRFAKNGRSQRTIVSSLFLPPMIDLMEPTAQSDDPPAVQGRRANERRRNVVDHYIISVYKHVNATYTGGGVFFLLLLYVHRVSEWDESFFFCLYLR